MLNRRFFFIIGLVLLLAAVVLVWYFVYVTPKAAPSLAQPTNPFPTSTFSRGFQFIFGQNKTGEEAVPQTPDATPAAQQTLIEIWNKPATGAAFVAQQVLIQVEATTTPKGTTTPIVIQKTVRATSTLLMFVDRTTGYIYGYNMEEGTINQLTNTTVIGVHDAYIYSNGKRVMMRRYDEDSKAIITIVANIPAPIQNGPPQALSQMTSLPLNVASIAINKKGDRLSYLVPNSSGSSIYTLGATGGTLVSTSPFSEWSLFYGGDTLYATTKPSAYLLGMTTALPSFEYLIGNKTGLMSNASDKGALLNSVWTDSGLVTYLSATQGEIILQAKTLASKCTWGTREFLICAIPKTLPVSDEGMPDDWLQGRTSFDDTLETVDVGSGTSYPLYSFDPSKGEMDVTNIGLSSDNKWVTFIRKQTGSLWLLRTENITY